MNYLVYIIDQIYYLLNEPKKLLLPFQSISKIHFLGSFI